MINVIFVVGPTASGKTAVSIELAKRFNGEIISADSMQIYKGIHIASAAPDIDEMQGVPHHLIEFLDLNQEFSVADYVLKSRECINNIYSRGKLPIVVGGTGLYISSLLDNIEFTDQSVDKNLRSQLEDKFDSLGGDEMLKQLSEFDSDAALKLHPNNKRRIIRAFEVYLQTGKTITEQNFLSKQNNCEIRQLVIGLNFSDRENLYQKINLRVDQMVEKGLIEEAKKTLSFNSKNGAFQAIGHKELYNYFENKCSFADAIELLKRQTRRYAKRQITWFKRDERINWLYWDKQDVLIDAIDLTQKFLMEE